MRDVNRARVLTVDEIMKPPTLRLSKERLDEALRQMQATGAKYGYVTDNGDYRGVVTAAAVSEAIARPAQPSLIELADPHGAVRAHASIEEALPGALMAEYDVPIIDGHGELVGVVSRESMSHVLGDAPEAAGLLGKDAAADMPAEAIGAEEIARRAVEATTHA